MDADYSVELGTDDPVLDFPWHDPEGKITYVDLKRHPELLGRVSEVAQFPEFGEFLRAVNSSLSLFESAKCDAWIADLNPDEEFIGLSHKFAGYVDLLFTDPGMRQSFPAHELFAKKLVGLLRVTEHAESSAEICIRRAFYNAAETITEGCYFTVYVSGFGNDDDGARLQWDIGLKLLANAVLQLSSLERA
jgi:hypothetical protein